MAELSAMILCWDKNIIPNKKVEIEAHTSVVTNEDKEKEISEKRLKKVTDYLIEYGVSKKQIETFAKGDKELLIEIIRKLNWK